MIVDCYPQKVTLNEYATFQSDRIKKWLNSNLTCGISICGRSKVIDIYQQPKLAKGEKIIATPTLIKKLPLPLRKLIGEMSDTERFLVGIDLKTKN
jgi:circadian clock protein KaiB